MTEEQIKRRDELAKVRSSLLDWSCMSKSGCGLAMFKEGYDAGYADANVKVADLEATLSRVNQTKIGEFIVYHPVLQPDEKTMVDLYVSMENQITELTRKLEVAKTALKEYALPWDKDKMPTQDNIESDYDCGCCSFGNTGARAFAALKELE